MHRILHYLLFIPGNIVFCQFRFNQSLGLHFID